MTLHSSELLRQWSSIVGVAALAIAGEVLIASAMRDLGDLDNHRTGPGLKGFLGPVKAVLSSPKFLIGAFCMAFNFFAMLWALSIVDLSPRSARHRLAHLHRQRHLRKARPGRKRRPPPLARRPLRLFRSSPHLALSRDRPAKRRSFPPPLESSR